MWRKSRVQTYVQIFYLDKTLISYFIFTADPNVQNFELALRFLEEFKGIFWSIIYSIWLDKNNANTMQMRRHGFVIIRNYNRCSYAIKHQVDRLIKFCADYTLFTYTKYNRTCNVSSRTYLQIAHRMLDVLNVFAILATYLINRFI